MFKRIAIICLLILLIFTGRCWALQNLSVSTLTEMAGLYVRGSFYYRAFSDGDVCFVFRGGSYRDYDVYTFDEDSGETEDGIYCVTPDYLSYGRAYTGDGRWIRTSSSVGSSVYYPNHAAADQGVTGSNDTVKYYVDTVGSEAGTIKFRHNSGDPNTVYTFSTPETIPSNIAVVIEKGAIIDGTLVFYSSGSIIAAPYQQIFAPTAAITYTKNASVYANWYGFDPDAVGTTNDMAIANAIANYRTIYICGGAYNISSAIDFTGYQRCEVVGEGRVDINCDTAGDRIVRLGTYGGSSSSRIVLRHLRFVATATMTYGIQMDYCTDSELNDIEISDTDIGTGIYISYSWDNNIYHTTVSCDNGIEFVSNNANNNNIFGARIQGNDPNNYTGIVLGGANNAMRGCDISSFNVGIETIRGESCLILSCYFEGNGTDIMFGNTAANADCLKIDNCRFRRSTLTGTSIDFTNSVGTNEMPQITNNWFKNRIMAIALDSHAYQPVIFGNTFDSCTTKVLAGTSKDMLNIEGRTAIRDPSLTTNAIRLQYNGGYSAGRIYSYDDANSTYMPTVIEAISGGIQFVVDSTGNIGIHSSSPTDTLYIDGNETVTGHLWVGGPLRSIESEWYIPDHHDMAGMDPGASGATWTNPSAGTTLGGMQLNAAGELLTFPSTVHGDWDTASDVEIKVTFEVNVDNSAGAPNDTVDIKVISYFKGNEETTLKTQTNEVATTVGQSAQYKQWTATIPIDYDDGSNPIDAGDKFRHILNLETDTSEVDDIIVNHIHTRYKSKKVHPEI